MTDEVETVINNIADDLTKPDVAHIHAIAAKRKQKRQTAGKVGGAAVVAFLVAGVGLWAIGRGDSGSTRLDTASGNTAAASSATDEIPVPTTSDPDGTFGGTPAVGVGTYDDFISLPVAEAGAFAEMEGVEWRVIVLDGESQEDGDDLVPGRLNFTVENGIVVRVQSDEDLLRNIIDSTDETPTTAAPSAAGIYLLLSIEEASDLADSQGEVWRVIEIDDVDQTVTADRLPGRLTFYVENGIVVEVRVEGDDAEIVAPSTTAPTPVDPAATSTTVAETSNTSHGDVPATVGPNGSDEVAEIVVNGFSISDLNNAVKTFLTDRLAADDIRIEYSAGISLEDREAPVVFVGIPEATRERADVALVEQGLQRFVESWVGTQDNVSVDEVFEIRTTGPVLLEPG